MPKTLALSKPKLSKFNDGRRKVKWDLLDRDGVGYRISWIEMATDTLKPECIALACRYDERGRCWTSKRLLSWNEQAVSHNPDAALALRDVMSQLKEKHGYTYEPEDAADPVYILPGEVVADGDY